MFDGLDFIGITRAVDQAIYMLLNTVATMLWRLDSALIGMSLYGYSTQDWLTGSGGGVWWILDWLIVNPGLFGINTWTLFAGLALMLWGLSRIARPFFNTSPVHPGKLLLFFLLSYIVIDQGSTLMQDIEQWRMDAGNAIYGEVSAAGDTSGVTVPAMPATGDTLATAADLDGNSPIRGWEAVSSSYFLVTDINELHQSYPPDNFRLAYCLYNPELPISSQNVVNAEGCSPRVAWDEWETVDIQMLEELLGFDVDSITDPVEEFFDWFGITLEIGDNIDTIPVLQHHPENRELAIRQSAAGISRLALGIIVALFPLVEANISLMLALAASFIYLSLPVVVLFGFFLPTESMVNRLVMQFVNVVLRTLVIHGIVAVFMLLLMDSALSDTLMSYLGMVGVGLVGGWWLMRLATATMKESMSQSMNAVGGVWMGASTGLLGKSAGNAAATTMGAAKFAGAGALLAGAGAINLLDIGEASYEAARSGEKDLRHGAPGAMRQLDRKMAQLPPALTKLAHNDNLEGETENGQMGANGNELLLDRMASPPLVMAGLAATENEETEPGQNGRSGSNGLNGNTWAGQWTAAGLAAMEDEEAKPDQNGRSGSNGLNGNTRAGLWVAAKPAATTLVGSRRQQEVDQWVEQTYEAQQSQRGQKQAGALGRDLVGEELAWKAERAMTRRSPEEARSVLAATRKTAADLGQERMIREGRITLEGLRAVKSNLDPETAQQFKGKEGLWDLATLSAMGVQEQITASPDEFQQTMAQAKGGVGQESPGHRVPQALGMDPVAAGPYYTAMNRFVRLSDEAGLSEEQRARLLAEAQRGEVSDELRAEIETVLAEQQEQGQAFNLTVGDIENSAGSLPATLSGPEQIWTTPARQPDAKPEDSGQSVSDAADGAVGAAVGGMAAEAVTGAAVNGTSATGKQAGASLGKELKNTGRKGQQVTAQEDRQKGRATPAPQATANAGAVSDGAAPMGSQTPSTSQSAPGTQPVSGGAAPVGGQTPPAMSSVAGESVSTGGQSNLGEELRSPPPLQQASASAANQTPSAQPASGAAPMGSQTPPTSQSAPGTQSVSGGAAPAGGQTPLASQSVSDGAAPIGGQTPPTMSSVTGKSVPTGGPSDLGQELRSPPPLQQASASAAGQTPPAMSSVTGKSVPTGGPSDLGQELRSSPPLRQASVPAAGQTPPAQPASGAAPMGSQTPPTSQSAPGTQPMRGGAASVGGQTPPTSQSAPGIQSVSDGAAPIGGQTPPAMSSVTGESVPTGGQSNLGEELRSPPPLQQASASVAGQTPPVQPVSGGPASMGSQTPPTSQSAPGIQPVRGGAASVGGQTPPTSQSAPGIQSVSDGAAPIGGQTPPAMSSVTGESVPTGGPSDLGQELRSPPPLQQASASAAGQTPLVSQPASGGAAPMGSQTPPTSQSAPGTQPVRSGAAPVGGQTLLASQSVNDGAAPMGSQTPPTSQSAPGTQPVRSGAAPIGGQTPPTMSSVTGKSVPTGGPSDLGQELRSPPPLQQASASAAGQTPPVQPVSGGPASMGSQTPPTSQSAPGTQPVRGGAASVGGQTPPIGGQTPPAMSSVTGKSVPTGGPSDLGQELQSPPPLQQASASAAGQTPPVQPVSGGPASMGSQTPPTQPTPSAQPGERRAGRVEGNRGEKSRK